MQRNPPGEMKQRLASICLLWLLRLLPTALPVPLQSRSVFLPSLVSQNLNLGSNFSLHLPVNATRLN